MRSTVAALILLFGLGAGPVLAQQQPGAAGRTARPPSGTPAGDFEGRDRSAAEFNPRLPRAGALVISEKAIMSAPSSAPVRVRQRDSLKNGAVIGAVIGGAVMGGFVGFLCQALHEEGNPSCIPDTLLWTGLGAGAGAAAGAGIDALAARQPSAMQPKLQWKVRF